MTTRRDVSFTYSFRGTSMRSPSVTGVLAWEMRVVIRNSTGVPNRSEISKAVPR